MGGGVMNTLKFEVYKNTLKRKRNMGLQFLPVPSDNLLYSSFFQTGNEEKSPAMPQKPSLHLMHRYVF